MTDPRKGTRVEAAEAKRRAELLEEERRAARLARAEARRERQAALQRRLAREVLYAGEGVSSLLHHTESDEAALARRGLPVLHDAADLADLLEVDIRRLRWLTYHRQVATVTHYRQFHIPKAKGGVRTIAAPRPALRAAQARLREQVLARLQVTDEAHAFVPGRSTLSNARPHVGQAILVKADIEDFFGTITFPRVRGLFRSLGYSGMVASLLALLTTESKRVAAEVDGATLYVAAGPRALPQGALTSPELTNQIARALDARLLGYARKHGWAYTRYADDLSFSRADGERAAVGPLLGTIARVLAGEGFRINRDKVFVSRAGRQQRVTGIVVNRQLGLPRDAVRRFRAAVHRVGLEGFRDEGERRQLLGYAAYVRMVKPELGARLLLALRAAPGPFRPAGEAPEAQGPEPQGPEPREDDAPKDDAPKDDAPKDDAPKDDAPKDDAPRDDAPKDDAPKDDAPKDDASKDDAPKDDAPSDDAKGPGGEPPA